MCATTDAHHTHCVSGAPATSIGVAINTAQHHLKMVPTLISGLHGAGIPSAAIHVFVGNSSDPIAHPCVTYHADPHDNIDFNAFYGLCDDRALLHSYPAWLYLHGSSAIASNATFRHFYDHLTPRTAKLCRTWNANYGVYASSDVAALCPRIQSIRNVVHTSSYEMKIVAYRYEDTLFKWRNVSDALLSSRHSGHCHVETARTRRYGGTLRMEWTYPDAGLCKYKSVHNHLHSFRYRTVDTR